MVMVSEWALQEFVGVGTAAVSRTVIDELIVELLINTGLRDTPRSCLPMLFMLLEVFSHIYIGPNHAFLSLLCVFCTSMFTHVRNMREEQLFRPSTCWFIR
jgi:hypothetical protein